MTTGLAALAAILLLGAGVVGYASRNAFDSDRFADRARAALDDEAVRTEIAERVTDELISSEADLVAVRPVIEGGISGIVGGDAFQALFRAAVADVHSAVFQGNRNSVTLTLADIGIVARGALQALSPRTAERIPPKADAEIARLAPPGWLAGLARLAEDVAVLALILLALAIALVALALRLSPDRRRTALAFGLAVAAAGVLAAVGLGVVRSVLLAQVGDPGAREAADGIWRAFLGDLRRGLVVFALCGGVIGAATSSLLRPVDLAEPLRRAWALAVNPPARPARRAARGIALTAFGVLVIVRHDAVIELVVILAGLYVAYAGVSELMRLAIASPDDAETGALRRSGRRALLATAVATAVIALVGASFVALGGIDEKPAAVVTAGCNGDPGLCGRRLDDVALATTHNAMSAATTPGWLFAQQDAGIPEQLGDGIRGLLIDAYYGEPTEGGDVRTDFSDVAGAERAKLDAALGPQAVDAALRIRDRIIDSPAAGPRGIYLCHGFCEVGAIGIADALTSIRDFLAANPNEVLVIVVQDYVTPDDLAEAFSDSGLIDYVYKGSVEPELPTLQEMIDTGGRVLMLAENDAGGPAFPWYHQAYAELTQETPYTFRHPRELTDPALLRASCRPNRGPADAPLFLVNHWVDTSPAPRPSNAAKVNSRRGLLDRIAVCDRRRGIGANLVAVDFYRRGDLFEVVAELNRAD